MKKPFAGVLLLFRKKVWEQVKFKEGILNVDLDFCRDAMDAGFRLKLMSGVYLFHFYRMDKPTWNIAHLL